MRRGALLVAVALVCATLTPAKSAQAIGLPASCGTESAAAKDATPLLVLRKRVEALAESDPTATMHLMCETIPRVARERGEDSVELAWWTASLATPLIAYMDKFQEAIPLLQFAQPILERHPGRESAALADIHVAYAWIYFRQGRLTDAVSAWQAALKVRDRAPGSRQIELQKVLVGLAQVRLAQRDFAATHKALNRARAILESNHDSVSEAGAAIENVETNLALREEDYARARTHAEAQLRIEQQLGGGAPQLVPAYVLLGTIYSRLEEFEASEAALRQAIALTESDHGPLQRHLLTALNQIATLLNERDRPREALPFAERALAVGETTLGPDAPKLVGVLRTLAEVYRSLGALSEALHQYQRAAGIVEHNRADIEQQVLVAHYRGLGDLELELGDLVPARNALAAALDAAGGAPTLTIERGHVLLLLALIVEPTDPERRQRLEQALALFKTRLPASHPLILGVINELCTAEIAIRSATTPNCQQAGAWLARALDVEPSLRSAIHQNESALSQAHGDSKQAYDEALEAFADAEAMGTPKPLWRAYFTVASALRGRADAPLAIFFGKQAINQIEQLRGDFTGSDRRLERTFLTDKVAAYRAVADWLMESGRIDEGLEVLRLLKGQELSDFELRSAARGSGARVVYTDEEERLRSRYASSMRGAGDAGVEIERLSRLRESGRLSAAERARLEKLLASQAASDASRLSRIREFLDVGADSAPPAQAHMRGIQAAILASELKRYGPDSALAVFLLSPSHLRVLVAARHEQVDYQVPLDSGALQRDIGHFLAAISRREDVTDASRALYETLARPMDEAAQRAHVHRLVLWLDGSLRYLPFAALSDGKRYLIDRYTLQAYSADHSLAADPVRARPSPLHVRGLGVTQAVGGFDALQAIADELCDVVRGPISGLIRQGEHCAGLTRGNGALPGAGYADAAFTEERLRAVLGETADYSVLHIGTHFSLRPGNTLRSFLVLGDGTKLSLEAVRLLGFSGLDLVTLSACQTGLGGATSDDGREIEGLSAIVQQGGARQVISSLWEVEDKSTAALMRQLYAGLQNTGGDAAGALREAQISVRGLNVAGHRAFEHPFYWAGFVASAK